MSFVINTDSVINKEQPVFNANRLQNLNISGDSPNDSDVLTWNDTTKLWEPNVGGGGSQGPTGPIGPIGPTGPIGGASFVTDTLSTTFDGAITSANITIDINKIGNNVTLCIREPISGTATVSDTIRSDSLLIAAYRPSQITSNVILISDNNFKGIGLLSVQTDGEIRIGNTINGTNFTASGTAGAVEPVSITYSTL